MKIAGLFLPPSVCVDWGVPQDASTPLLGSLATRLDLAEAADLDDCTPLRSNMIIVNFFLFRQ
jgi:hypothetical protein